MHYFQIYSTDFVRLNAPLIAHEFSVNLKSNRELSMYVFWQVIHLFFILMIFAEMLKVSAPQAIFTVRSNKIHSEVNMLLDH